MPDTVEVSAADVQVVSSVLTLAARAFGSALGHIPCFGDALEACGRLEAATAQAVMPQDPVASIDQLAITQHEMLEAYVRSGFERSEAFHLVLTLVQANATASAMRGMHG